MASGIAQPRACAAELPKDIQNMIPWELVRSPNHELKLRDIHVRLDAARLVSVRTRRAVAQPTGKVALVTGQALRRLAARVAVLA
jgi:hypothetical protein